MASRKWKVRWNLTPLLHASRVKCCHDPSSTLSDVATRPSATSASVLFEPYHVQKETRRHWPADSAQDKKSYKTWRYSTQVQLARNLLLDASRAAARSLQSAQKFQSPDRRRHVCSCLTSTASLLAKQQGLVDSIAMMRDYDSSLLFSREIGTSILHTSKLRAVQCNWRLSIDRSRLIERWEESAYRSPFWSFFDFRLGVARKVLATQRAKISARDRALRLRLINY